MRGIQSNHVISTLKHFAINPQETGRAFMNTVIAEDALARKRPAGVRDRASSRAIPARSCAPTTPPTGAQSCGNRFLLTEVLREDWDYQGFVMSDWGAVDAVDYALAGLDQQSGAAIDPQPFFGAPLKALAQSDPNYGNRLGEMARRILWAIYDNGLDAHPAAMGDGRCRGAIPRSRSRSRARASCC